MNTPAHALINLALLSKHDQPARTPWVIAFASVLPDLPMILFYAVQKTVYQTEEDVIWNDIYYEPLWQNFFDFFNSIPIILLGIAVAYIRKMKLLLLVFFSMGLHVLQDFFLHNEDAHRHFFPLSSWQFQSPVSYWDPAHHGILMSWAEITLTFWAAFYLIRKFRNRNFLILVTGFLAVYFFYFAYVFSVWI